ncbi:unnamed protein product [Meloidogyne enterolobii]|uniref:Uncharacterized protein n=1 Tax=Meloidogyne enterolobii TaxID=390850 RepID=A0ACB0ZSC8_MELEN
MILFLPSIFIFYSLSTIILALLIWRLFSGFNNAGKMPPGPFHFPLIGNFAKLDLRYPHRSFVYWKQRYGPIYTVPHLSKNDSETVRSLKLTAVTKKRNILSIILKLKKKFKSAIVVTPIKYR